MDGNGLMVKALARGEYGGIWHQKGDVFPIAEPSKLGRWMTPADPKDARWAVPAPDVELSAGDQGASDTARLSRIEAKLDWIIEKMQAALNEGNIPTPMAALADQAGGFMEQPAA